jgi:putative sugar O-methyltransferase
MNENDLSTLRAMFGHVSQIDEDLRPSGFWIHYCKQNEAMLTEHGIENFKRTVNQNYYNWIPWATDNLYQQVEAYWKAHPDPVALQVEIEDLTFLRRGFDKDNPLSAPEARASYARFVGMLWHYVRHSEPNGVLDRLSEPELGNPIRTRLGGRLISQDLANSVKEQNTILHQLEAPADPARRLVVGELGAGYGRVAYVFLATHPVQYVIVDLPPALFVSQWYLSRLFPERRVFTFRPFGSFDEIAGELAAADLAFLTPDQFYLLPDRYFDIFLTISSLAEMTPSQVSQYIGLMCNKTKSRIYIKQWREWVNKIDRVAWTQEDYDLQPGWHKRIDRIDSVQDEFFETLWEAD